MANYVALAIEGVLLRAGPDKQPVPEGVRLYEALRKVYKVALLTSGEDDKVEDWLSRQGIKGYTALVGPPRVEPYEKFAFMRSDQIKDLRSHGYSIELFIDANPAAVANALHLGITGLVFASPVYARPEFRPDATTKVRAWDEIEAEVGRQNALKSQEHVVPTADLGV